MTDTLDLPRLDPPRTRDLGRVLVSGGGSGLGAAIVAALDAHGATPVVLDRDLSRVPSGVDGHRVDLVDPSSVQAAVARTVREHDGLDAVVTTAGIDHPGAFSDVSEEAWEQVIAVNLLGTARVIRAALPALEQSHGRIVTVASSLALRAVPDATAYCASKFGVLGFSRALAAELRGRVGLTTLVPAGMRTPFFDGRPDQYRPGDDAQLTDPAVVAESVLFALSQPAGVELRELVICHEEEGSWP